MSISMTYTTTNHHTWLLHSQAQITGRNARPVVIPRAYQFRSITGRSFPVQYGIIGAGVKYQDFALTDGVNEVGLSATALPSASQAHYNATPRAGKINLAPFEVVNWLLGTNRDNHDVHTRLGHMRVVNFALPPLRKSPSLQWLIADRAGHCNVLTFAKDGIHWTDNPAGVLTTDTDIAQELAAWNEYHEQLEPAVDANVTSAVPNSVPRTDFATAVMARAQTPAIVDHRAIATVTHLLTTQVDQTNTHLALSYMQLSNATYYFQPTPSDAVTVYHRDEGLLGKKNVTVLSSLRNV